MELIITIGLPASGKDYIYKNLYSKTHTHISSDLIREEVFGDINDQTHNNEVFEKMKNDCFAAIDRNEDIYYNATNISRKRRLSFMNVIRNYCRKNEKDITIRALVFNIPIENVLKNNRERERVVPENVIYSMLKRFQMPAPYEKFDSVLLVKSFVSGSLILSRLSEALTLCHNNPNHSSTIGRHMVDAHNLIPENKKLLRIAALYHDIGKPLVKTFDDNSVAHYYCHENVGAYIYLSEGNGYEDSNYLSTNERLYITNLIENHMKFYHITNMDIIEYDYGSEFLDDLIELHKADQAAH